MADKHGLTMRLTMVVGGVYRRARVGPVKVTGPTTDETFTVDPDEVVVVTGVFGVVNDDRCGISVVDAFGRCGYISGTWPGYWMRVDECGTR